MGGVYLRLAWNHLRRGEQRVLVALACITFGVMSLAAMLIVSQSLLASLVLTPQQQLGGDVNLFKLTSDQITREDEAALQALQAEGAIDQYMLIAQAGELMWRRPESGETHWAAAGLGIDPNIYPLAGQLLLDAPASVGLPTVLGAVGDVIITRDLAEGQGLKIGDTLLLSDLEVGAPVTVLIRGIAGDTPNHQGNKFYYNFATAEALAGGQRAANVALLLSPAPAAVLARLEAQGWGGISVEAIAAASEDRQDLFLLLLKGAGMLGLMVGGIGIANTMQVLLRRRQKEIAIWKTLGYTTGQLRVLFVVEAALLGAAGSVLGAGLGALVSRGLLTLILRTGNVVVNWTLDNRALLVAGLAGLVTTVIFALWAIVRAAGVPPMSLLRETAEPLGAQARRTWPATLALLGLLAVPFAALTAVVMDSVSGAVWLLLIALGGLVALGGGLAGLAWAATRLLAVPGLPLLRLAQNSLRRRGLGLVFGMIALFTGIVALALGVVLTQNAQAALAERVGVFDSYEVALVAPAREEAAIRQALADAGQSDYSVGYSTAVQAVTGAGLGAESPRLLGQTRPYDFELDGAPWGSDPQGAYPPRYYGLVAGDTVTVTLADGRLVTLPVVGTYLPNYENSPRPEDGLLVPAALSQQLAPPETVLVYVEAPQAAAALAQTLGQALPGATVIDMVAYAARFTQNYRNLFLLAVTMAGLALLAGVLLVANAVTLAMLDRQYEIGVLKAVGYTRGQVLATLLAEYGLMGLLATGAALAAVQVFLLVVGLANPLAGALLVLRPAWALVILVVGVGLTLATVLAATWRPTGVSPVVILNDRG